MDKPTVLMLPGLGGDKKSMQPFVDYCGARLAGTQIVAIESPMNFGTDTDRMLGWFVAPDDRHRSIDGPDRPQLTGIVESVAFIHSAIRHLIDDGSEPNNIHLLGHSQGGAIAIAAGLTFPERLGSVCTIAGYLALTPDLSVLATGTQYFLHHSIHDDNVTVRWAHYAEKFLHKAGEPCQLTCWDIERNPHAIHTVQLDSICAAIAEAE